MQKTLYIYTSGYEEEYQMNLYRTLSFPEGAIVRYTFKKDSGFRDELRLSRYKVLIVFVDRSCQPDYKFYPIREALFKSSRESAHDPKKVNFFVELGGYVFPRDCNSVSRTIESMSNRPRKSNDPTTPTQDGAYVSLERSIIPAWKRQRKKDYYTGDEAWRHAAETLYNMPAFCADLSGTNINLDNYNRNNNRVPLFFHVKCVEKRLGRVFKLKPHCETTNGSTLSYYWPLKNVSFGCEWNYYPSTNLPASASLCPRLTVSYDKDGNNKTFKSSDPEDTALMYFPILEDPNKLTIGMDWAGKGASQTGVAIYCPDIELELRPRSADWKRNLFRTFVVLCYVAVSFTLDEKSAILEIVKSLGVGNSAFAIFKYVMSNWGWLALHIVRLSLVLLATRLFESLKPKPL